MGCRSEVGVGLTPECTASLGAIAGVLLLGCCWVLIVSRALWALLEGSVDVGSCAPCKCACSISRSRFSHDCLPAPLPSFFQTMSTFRLCVQYMYTATRTCCLEMRLQQRQKDESGMIHQPGKSTCQMYGSGCYLKKIGVDDWCQDYGHKGMHCFVAVGCALKNKQNNEKVRKKAVTGKHVLAGQVVTPGDGGSEGQAASDREYSATGESRSNCTRA